MPWHCGPRASAWAEATERRRHSLTARKTVHTLVRRRIKLHWVIPLLPARSMRMPSPTTCALVQIENGPAFVHRRLAQIKLMQ
jgi:hypothetical protein